MKRTTLHPGICLSVFINDEFHQWWISSMMIRPEHDPHISPIMWSQNFKAILEITISNFHPSSGSHHPFPSVLTSQPLIQCILPRETMLLLVKPWLCLFHGQQRDMDFFFYYQEFIIRFERLSSIWFSIMQVHNRYSILAWEIPWTEEPGGYSSRGHKELYTMEHAHMPLELLVSPPCLKQGQVQDGWFCCAEN